MYVYASVLADRYRTWQTHLYSGKTHNLIRKKEAYIEAYNDETYFCRRENEAGARSRANSTANRSHEMAALWRSRINIISKISAFRTINFAVELK